MASRDILHDVLRVFDNDEIFVGATISCDDTNIAQVQALPNVIQAFRVRLISQPTFSPSGVDIQPIDN